MDIKLQIDQNLKSAMLAGDKTLVTTLRGLKGAILNVEIAQNARETGLPNDQVITLLQKESKKRQESADLYSQGGNVEKQQAELAEKKVIEEYLPAQLGEPEVIKIVEEAVKEIGTEQKNMGQIIGHVRQQTGGNADGALIARLVKERLS